jgi:hypothetical protein
MADELSGFSIRRIGLLDEIDIRYVSVVDPPLGIANQQASAWVGSGAGHYRQHRRQTLCADRGCPRRLSVAADKGWTCNGFAPVN